MIDFPLINILQTRIRLYSVTIYLLVILVEISSILGLVCTSILNSVCLSFIENISTSICLISGLIAFSARLLVVSSKKGFHPSKVVLVGVIKLNTYFHDWYPNNLKCR